jgi:plastocyanin
MTPPRAPHTSRRLVFVAVAGGLLVSATGATAAPAVPAPAVAVAGPEAATAGFVSRAVVSVQGQALSFANGDVAGHTLTSKATKPKKVKYGKKYYIIQVPLFDSDSVNGGAVGDVKGVTSLKPGTYDFYCSLHTGMTGQLMVQAAG